MCVCGECVCDCESVCLIYITVKLSHVSLYLSVSTSLIAHLLF